MRDAKIPVRRILFVATLALGLMSTFHVVRSAPAGTPVPMPRVVNVTSDSEPGWAPSKEDEDRARKTALDYLADLDSGKYTDAYSFLAEIDRRDQPLPDFAKRAGEFNASAGAVVERRIVTVTWTKNPKAAPLPGVYAAIDLVSRFANVDRHCGFLVLFQAKSGGAFQVMREENNYIDNATALGITGKSGAAELDRAWADVSSHCPNYQTGKPPAPLPEATGHPTGYASVAEALADLHTKASVVFSIESGWTIATDKATNTIWSFPPPGNSAFPAAVKRQFVEQNGAVILNMSVQCEASKSACDDLVRQFQQLNAAVAASIRGRQ